MKRLDIAWVFAAVAAAAVVACGSSDSSSDTGASSPGGAGGGAAGKAGGSGAAGKAGAGGATGGSAGAGGGKAGSAATGGKSGSAGSAGATGGKAGSGGSAGATGGKAGSGGKSGSGGSAGATGGKAGAAGAAGGKGGAAGASGKGGSAGAAGSAGGAGGAAGKGGSAGAAGSGTAGSGTAGAGGSGTAGTAGSGAAGSAGAAGSTGGPLCNDNVKNGNETDVDCGGGTCAPCANGLGCTVASDCTSGGCSTLPATLGTCVDPCADGIKNGNETDIDCGGGTCAPCATGLACALGTDCASGACSTIAPTANTCVDACADGIKNGNETDVDCGGGTCAPCGNGLGCAVASDCTSGGCSTIPATLNTCVDPCADGIKNGNETDIDCGGGTCAACAVGMACAVTADCATFSACAASVCTSVNQNLLLYWKFDDAPGSTTAADSTGNAVTVTGQVVGNGAFVGGGKQGGAYSFDGVGTSCIAGQFPNTAQQNTGLFIPQGNETFAMWIKLDPAQTIMGGLQVVSGANQPCSISAGFDRTIGDGPVGPGIAGSVGLGSAKPQFNVWSEVNFQETASAPLNDGAWHHIVYVLDGTTGLLAYVDGQLAGMATKSNGCVNCSDFTTPDWYNVGNGLGSRFRADGFVGLMDEVRIYSVPLTAAQVDGLYQATK